MKSVYVEGTNCTELSEKEMNRLYDWGGSDGDERLTIGVDDAILRRGSRYSFGWFLLILIPLFLLLLLIPELPELLSNSGARSGVLSSGTSERRG